MRRTGRGCALIASGVVLASIALGSDLFGLGETRTFGWKQALGAGLGGAAVVLGVLLRRFSPAGAKGPARDAERIRGLPSTPSGCLAASSKLLAVPLGIAVALCLMEVGLRVLGRARSERFYASGIDSMRAKSRAAGATFSPILFLGESSTAGLGLEDPRTESYPSQLVRMLNDHYGERFVAVIPPHLGQNTSQVLSRLPTYLKATDFCLAVIMAGINDTWSMGESNIAEFLPSGDPWETWKLRTVVLASELRLFKVLRYGYVAGCSRTGRRERNVLHVSESPTFDPYPPPREIVPFAREHPDAFARLVTHNLRGMVRQLRDRSVPVLLMTYHLGDRLNAMRVELARELDLPIVRNDLAFSRIREQGALAEHVLGKPDRWHPNARGYRVIAETAFQTIRDRDLVSSCLGKADG